MMIDQMDKVDFGDIVLMNFPFTDGQQFKKRPALVLLDTQDGDMIVCRITSKLYYTEFDVTIEGWQAAGLKLPSVIRVHKIATLEKDMIIATLGAVDDQIKESIRQVIGRLI